MGIFQQFPYSNFHEYNLDELIKMVRKLADEWVAYQQAWGNLYTDTQQALQDFKDYVYEYFENLDLQDEVNKKINAMVGDGTFDAIVITDLSPVITTWLQENITQDPSVIIDSSLSIGGAAADAKVTGDDIRDLYNKTLPTKNLLPLINGSDNGITITPNRDGSMHISGTSTAIADLFIDIPNLENTNYTLSAYFGPGSSITSGSNLVIFLRDVPPGESGNSFAINVNSTTKVTRNTTMLPIRYDITLPANVTINADLYIQLETGNYATSFLPHVTAVDYVLREKDFRYLTPEMFGAVGDDVTDDRPAFVAMFNSAQAYDTILLSSNKKYYISSPISIAENFLKIQGFAQRDEYRPVIRSALTSQAALLTFTGAGIILRGFCLDGGITQQTTGVLVEFNPVDVHDGNIDAEVDNVVLFKSQYGIRARGRNVRVHDCLCSNIGHVVHAVQTTADTDNRGYEVVNNRFHYCGNIFLNGINNSRADHNIVIANNFADMTSSIFKGYTGGVVIKDNVVYAYAARNDDFMILDADLSQKPNVIDGNIFFGQNTGANKGIYCRSAMPITIVNNIFNGCNGIGVIAYGDTKIMNNVFENCGTSSGDTGYVMEFRSTANAIVMNNMMSGFTDQYKIAGTATVVLQNNYPQ